MSSDNNWMKMYEDECRLMGMDSVPAQRDPAAEGLDPEYAKFPYAVITPESLDTPDEDCFVLILLAEGFRTQDMDKWHYHAQHFTRIVLTYPPFNEFTKNIKILRVDAVSNEEGISGDVSPDGRYPWKDTYFKGRAWANNQQRLGRGVAAVLVLTHAGVDVHALHGVRQGEIAADGGAGILRHLPLALLPFGEFLFGLGKQRVEGLRAIQNIVQFPGPARVHFRAAFRLLHAPSSVQKC